MKLPVNYDNLSISKKREVRNEYVKIQEGKCCYCGALLTGNPTDKVRSKVINTRLFPEGFFKYPVHLHHSHDSGLTIGAVHSYCNAVAFQYEGI